MDDLFNQLKHKMSAKRRSAAKNLRKIGDVRAGPFLLEALKKEIKDVRTWETQYQMIMAIGECGYKDALPFLFYLTEKDFEATMVYVALGDSIVRLSDYTSNMSSLISLIATENYMLIEGGLRAMAMMQLVPRDEDIHTILTFVSQFPIDEGIHFWLILATAGWSGDNVTLYLEQCSESERDDIQEAVELSKQKKYKKWRPL